jgi:hypothetical protein
MNIQYAQRASGYYCSITEFNLSERVDAYEPSLTIVAPLEKSKVQPSTSSAAAVALWRTHVTARYARKCLRGIAT